MLQDIKNTIQKIENYRDDSFVYAHLVGIMSVELTNQQVKDMHNRIKKELEMKEISNAIITSL